MRSTVQTIVRGVAVLALSGGLVAAPVVGAVAAEPAPLPGLDSLTSGTTPVDGLLDTLAGTLGPGGSPLPIPLPSLQGPTDPADDVPADGSTPAATPSSPDRPSATAPTAEADADQPATGGAATTPLGDLCFLAPESGGTAVRVAGTLLGQDLAQQLIDAAPQAFAPCPDGAVPAGDDLLGAGVLNIEDLLGLCVRVTETVAPLQTILVLLDTDVIRALTDAGVPLQQLVVPCPSAAAAPAPTTDPAATPRPTPAAQDPQQASAIPVADTGRLAFTGSQTGPYLLVATVLVCLGALLVQRSRLVPARAAVRPRRR